jgi:putative transposase
MSASTSAFSKLRYGVERVCRTWQFPRSTYYASLASAKRASTIRATQDTPIPGRRGPRPRISDAGLLAEIVEDLARSPFRGEGHRKVWARLRVQRGISVARKRVLRVMRENHLLSPYRVPKASQKLHDGVIATKAPNLMWGTDGVRIFTVRDGWIWLFAVVEHWNAECVGWHVCKVGNRFNALQALSMAVQQIFGSVGPDAARGLKLRMDHGTQFLSNHYQKQIAYWGIAPSFCFVEEPQTNGVAERFNRTLKEQAVYGHVFGDLQEVRKALGTFVANYNAAWHIEKLGFLSPSQAREAHGHKMAA